MIKLLSDNASELTTISKKNLDILVSLVEELVINKVRIEKMKNELYNNAQVKILDQELRIISEIQDSIKRVRLIKIKTIHNALIDLVNQYSKDYGIDANLAFEGQDTQIESSLINYIHSIFSYFIKDIFENEFVASANITNEINISVHSDGKSLTAVIESNGRGFDNEAICKKLNKEAIDLLLLTVEEIKEFLNLTNNYSNMESLLKLRQDLLSLDGSIKFASESNEFRRVTLIIPLSSSIMQGLLVTIAHQVYAIPLEFIETILDKSTIEIKKSKNSQMILYMDQVIRLISISELLGIEANVDSSCVLIVSSNNHRAALLVDTLLDQTDMVIKESPPIIQDINEIKGTTILGDGLVTLVLDIPFILKEI